MDIKFEPPTLNGSKEEKEKQLIAWLRNFCMELNLAFDILESEVKDK